MTKIDGHKTRNSNKLPSLSTVMEANSKRFMAKEEKALIKQQPSSMDLIPSSSSKIPTRSPSLIKRLDRLLINNNEKDHSHNENEI